jgi:hypothetical protein
MIPQQSKNKSIQEVQSLGPYLLALMALHFNSLAPKTDHILLVTRHQT